MTVRVHGGQHEVPVGRDHVAGHGGQLRGVPARRAPACRSCQLRPGRTSELIATVAGMARFHQLCIDTANPGSDIATFWAAVSGGTVKAARSGGPSDVEGRADHESIAIVPVPEPKTVKNRVHLDVYTLAVATWSPWARRSTCPPRRAGSRWTTMRDPEGNEFCAFVRDELPEFRIHGIVVDSRRPRAGRDLVERGPRRRAERQRRARRRLVDPAPRHPGRRPDHGLRARARAQDGQEPRALGRRRRPSTSSSTAAPPTCGTGRAGSLSPTRRATSSACSPRGEAGRDASTYVGPVTDDDRPAPEHRRPEGVDDRTVEALGKLSEALEVVEDARAASTASTG